jgi:DNA-binding transcriptional MerR regulator/effector-binding domain-containing protein
MMFTIGPFARLAGVSPKMLRSYDALGLFRPVWLDRSTGYRYYSPAQLPELRRIAALRDVGIGLAEIGRLVAGGADLRAALDRRRAELVAERAEIDRRLAALDIRVRGGSDGADSAEPEADVVVRPIPPEFVALRAVAEGEDDGGAFHELESYVRDRGRRARRPPGALVPPDGDWEIFVPLTGPVAPTPTISVRRLPACRAATLIVRGPYERIAGARSALEGWLAAAGLRPAGSLRIVYLQFGAERELRIPAGYVVERATEFVTELQLPVDQSRRRAFRDSRA